MSDSEDNEIVINCEEEKPEEKKTKTGRKKKQITDEERERLRNLLVKAREAKQKKKAEKKPTPKPTKGKKKYNTSESDEESDEEDRKRERRGKARKERDEKLSALQIKLDSLIQKLDKPKVVKEEKEEPKYDRYKAEETRAKNNILKLF